jgi:hypothetical protein
MRWRLGEIPLRKKSFRSQFTPGSDQAGAAPLEQSGILRLGKIEALHPTDPPR